ncbi:ubiquitin thioesterase OTU1 [Nannizzia gypsea CBS 118893]|uniref:Ubiquitin thioesterase OTU n=1 Tax=Arthroderma gypseum (strain ATCC MYA-4604 / CBS 118893) TaxID=535722 RepID=E4UXB6_ARTGP|nr:ubiquitin thioesterase OTU1 [Nannizzia gypsea CBS 118893]EFR02703.1 ubiquitin thioesterase OTU1 [Nannizzia gypsea CBS 118893]
MRLRIRGPNGQSAITLEDTATVEELLNHISQVTTLSSFDIKYGYPPQPLTLSQFDAKSKVIDIGVNLNGEQLIVSKREEPAGQPQPSNDQAKGRSAAPLSLTKKKSSIEDNAPEIPSPEHGGTIVLRVMPDDNSCLFRAVGSAVIGAMDTMTELRSIIAQSIQAQPDFYTTAVLEKSPDDYCRWIQTEHAWGGGIELGILSKHFEIEICSIDVQTLRIDRFNEGCPTRCIVVYSGIHYDTVALSPSDEPYTHAYAPPEFDTRIFDSSDSIILEKAIELCRILKEKHYYTDTSNFQIKCNICGGLFIGEKGATAHASETGHYDFGEAG